MRKLIGICVLVMASSLNLKAQTDENRVKEFVSKFDAYIQLVAEKLPEVPAISVVVIKDDKPIFLKAYGWADKEAGVKADINTLFYISSTTKPFMALVAALLDKEGTVKLNEPLTKYSKGVSFKNTIPEKVTVQNLLTHTSGLQNEALKFRMSLSGEIETNDILTLLGDATTYIDSNHNKYSYSNLGYNIYGILLQQSPGKKWQDLLQERIFRPMKLDHTTTYASTATARKLTIAYPYVYTGEKGLTKGWLEKKDNNMHSAGGMFTSIGDMGAWLNMHMNNGRLNGKQIFPAAIIKKCHTGYTRTKRELAPFTGDGEYGLGWQIGTYKNEKVIYHHGGYPGGYHNHASFFPDKKIAVAVCVTEATVGSIAERFIATYAYEWWLGTDNIDDSYTKKLDELVRAFDAGKKSEQDGAATRAKRTSQLTSSLENYAGKYVHPAYGTLEIYLQDNTLVAKQGLMEAVITPYTEQETARVELVPGSGQVLKFKKSAENKIEAAVLGGQEYKRIK
jgi:CubicO group peptidase (beta-lactamase class C family)